MLQWATFDQNSVIVRVKILDSSVTTGAGKTGLSSSSSGLIISTIADSEATATAYTQAGSTIESITTLGTYAAPTATKCRFKEVDATNHPGIYEMQFADARFSIAASKSLLISLSGVSGMAQCDAVIPLPTVDLFDSVRGGMTALPNAAAEASGGLITRGTGTGQIELSSGKASAQVKGMDADTVTASAIATDAIGSAELATTAVNEIRDAILSDSTAFAGASIAAIKTKTDSLTFTSAGKVDANLKQIDEQATNDYNATLKLKQLDIENSAGDALVAKSTGGNGRGFTVSGNGSGPGMSVVGGDSADGIYAEGGATVGIGIVGVGHGVSPGIEGDAGSTADAYTAGILGWSPGGGGAGVLGYSEDGDGVRGTSATGGSDIKGNIEGNLSGTIGGLTAPALKDFFDTDSTTTYGSAVAGSVVKEIVDNAGGAAPTAIEIADAVLTRNVSNVEGSAGEHTLCTIVLAMLENEIVGTTLTIKRTDGSTTHYTKTLTTDPAAEPIVGID